MTNKKIVILLMAALLVVSLTDLFASGGRRNGTAGAQELLIPVGARGVALHSANIAGLSGVESIYYNPAGLSGMTGNVESMFSYMNYIADINMVYAAVGVNLRGLGSLAFTLKALDVADIPETTVERPEGTGSKFSTGFTVIGVTYSNYLTEKIKAGVTMHLVSEKIANSSATGVSIDAGIQYNKFAFVDGLQLGVVVKSFGTQMRYDGPDLYRNAEDPNSNRGLQMHKLEAASFELPSQMMLGLSYQKNFNDFYSTMITTAFQNNNFSNDEFILGAEVGFKDMLFLRGGYSYVSEAADNADENIFGPTFGVGLNIKGGMNITVDYAYRVTKYFNDNQLFQVKLMF